jgi:ElaB/YqjD/DUF883 family membrane-anchored ribosome-binding protein
MDELIDRLRDPRLAVKMLGYDRARVDALLDEAAASLEAWERRREPTVRSEVSGIGARVEQILASAADAADAATAEARERAEALTHESEQGAEHLRREAEDHAAGARRQADEYAARVRAEAEEEAERLRADAETRSEARVASAEEESAEIIREAEDERERLRREVDELRERREMVVANLERLRGSLGSMVGEAERGTTEWAAAGEEGLAVEEETDPFATVEDRGDAGPTSSVEGDDLDGTGEPETEEDFLLDDEELGELETEEDEERDREADQADEDPEPTVAFDVLASTGEESFDDSEELEQGPGGEESPVSPGASGDEADRRA